MSVNGTDHGYVGLSDAKERNERKMPNWLRQARNIRTRDARPLLEMKVMELMETAIPRQLLPLAAWCKSSEELEEKHCDACVLIQALNLRL